MTDMNRKLILAVLVSLTATALMCGPGAAQEPKTQLEVRANPQEISVYPGEIGGFDISINNSDNESVALKLAGAQLPSDWTLRFSINGSPTDSIEVGPLASVNFTAEAMACETALAGTYTLVCNMSDNRSHSWEQPLVVHVLQTHDFSLSSALAKKLGIPGGTVEFRFNVANRGNGPDRISFDTDRLPVGFGVAFYHNGTSVDGIDLAANQHENITMRVTIPAGFTEGYEEIDVFGTSESGLTDTIKFTITSNQSPLNVELRVGPLRDEAGSPVGGALVALSDAGGRWSNVTDNTGMAIITAHSSCLDTDVMVTATHNEFEDLEFPGTVGLSDFTPSGGVYPPFKKRPQVMVGPILGNDGKLVAGARLELSDGVHTYSGLTDEAGRGGIYIPKALLGKPVHLTIGCKGFVDRAVEGNVSLDGKFVPEGGSYPPLVKRTSPTPANGRTNPVPEVALWTGFGFGLLIIAGIIGGTEVGKVGFFSFIMPLYSRVNKDKVLDNFSRGIIYGHVVEHPGINFTELKGLSNIANGTLTYHLKVLEGEGMIVAHNRGTHRIFFPSSLKVSTRDLVLNKSEQMVYSMIRASPGIAQAKLAEEANLSEATIHRIVTSLENKSIVMVEKGVRNRCFVKEEPASREEAVPVPSIFAAER